jgi:hypothetical protein
MFSRFGFVDWDSEKTFATYAATSLGSHLYLRQLFEISLDLVKMTQHLPNGLGQVIQSSML